ncbi:MAG TPA: universal stress protein [Candidatus Limnocylindrales bacterium]|nr:universal stress protein [Candidatus Limnocylindrales bacterium]
MFKRILLAVDGSDYSRDVIPAAAEVAAKFDADVFVLHVFERDLGRAGAFPMETPDEATKIVSNAVAALKAKGVQAEGEVQHAISGHAAKHIVETAQTRNCDLIVMGSRGLSDLGGLLLGSVTHKVLQLAHVPVLVIKHERVPSPALSGAASSARA